jgi:hypothetical protein
MTRPPFRSISAPLDVDDATLAKVADKMGVPTLVSPTSPVAADTVQTPPMHALAPTTEPTRAKPNLRSKRPPAVPRPEKPLIDKLTIELPGYLVDAVKRRALDQRSTARHVILLALRDAGFQVEAGDLIPDGRRTRPDAA